ncbi:TerD family protein [Actinomadura sp. WMMA1423]|uniref:TerD family protein n=1 Tax=Actinomadura sp. WMMA1423 TaxID=2591108 RepID=UPI001146F498|nr:TerD family protein [Actinomadura sp. WMMA1423]
MAALSPGANAALPVRRVVATASCAVPVDVSALLVGPGLRARSDADLVFYNAPEVPGVRWSGDGRQRVEVDLDAVDADAAAVLIAVSLTGATTFGTMPAPRLDLTTGTGDPLVEFTVPGLGPERAIIGLELYRRDGRWKVRAVGQGYAGGLAELLEAHGIEVDDPGEPEPAPAVGPPPQQAGPPPLVPPPASPPPASSRPPAPPPTSEVGYVERCWLVWEDASRSMAAFHSSTEHALVLRNEEIAGRKPPGGFQRLMDAAHQRLRDDAAQLRDELARVEPQVTPEVAPFDAPSWLTWQPRADLAEGVLLGRLSTAELPDLRVPLVLRLPWRRAVWISQGTMPGDSAAYAWSLVTRFLAAVPPGVAGLEVIDAAGLSGAGWLHGFDQATTSRLLGGGVAIGAGAAQRMRRLLDLVDLRRIGGDDGPAAGPPLRLVVVLDAGAALDGEESHHLLRLVEDGPLVGVPVILVETDTPAAESVRAMRLRQSCNDLPSSEGSIADSWVGAEWTLTPEVLPDTVGGTRAPALFAHVLGTHSRAGTAP